MCYKHFAYPLLLWTIPGLIPLHNAASYGHLDIAALLIKHGTNVNTKDRWGFTPLHEAAQKGRTQLCALLLNYGADPKLKNLENQTALDLATAEDVRCLLLDAMASLDMQVQSQNAQSNQSRSSTTTTNTDAATVISNDNTLNEPIYSNDALIMTTDVSQENSGDFDANRVQSPSPNPLSNSTNGSSYDIPNCPSSEKLLLLQKNRANVNEDNTPDNNKPDGNSHVTNTLNYKSKSSRDSETKNSSTSLNTNVSLTSNASSKKSIVSISSYIDAALPPISMQDFLTSLNLPHLVEIFEKEMISIDILAEMGHDELKQIGVQAYGHRHKLLKAVEKLLLHTASVQAKQTIGGNSFHRMYLDTSLQSVLSENQCKSLTNSQTVLIDLHPSDRLYELVEEEMQSSIREHKDGNAGGVFTRWVRWNFFRNSANTFRKWQFLIAKQTYISLFQI